MGSAYFYHLTQRPLVDTLRNLTERSLANGWRVAIRGQDPAGLEALDNALWQGPEGSFLPHGMAGGAHDALQPALLTTGTDLPNGASCVMAVHGAAVSAEEVAALDRVCILFDGYDEEAVQTARGQWKTLTGAGAKAQYWSEESGQWEMKAESK
ncbi:MAG: DNA polymerase III subunit chi [Sulfitobacter sp.]